MITWINLRYITLNQKNPDPKEHLLYCLHLYEVSKVYKTRSKS